MLEYINQLWQTFLNRPDFWAVLSIIPVTAFVTWAHVWMALKMVFYPINFWGFHLGPLPVGWQGIVPRKAGRISGIITDNTLSKLGSLREFLDAMDPEDIERFQSRIKTARKTERVSIKLNLNETDIARFSEVKFQFPGVNIENQMTRYYPHGELFAHVIGYVGRINDKELKEIDKDAYAGTNLIGKIGVEKSYEHLLHGVPGNESVEADAHGNVLRHLGRKDPVRGNDLYLSLDYGLQVVASEQLAGRRGAIVALDPRTGEILALVSSPSFNPNLFVTGISHTNYAALRDNIDQPLYNRAVQGVYPPGSTIKPMFGLGGIHYGLVDWSTAIQDYGYFTLPGDSHRFRDHKKNRGMALSICTPLRWCPVIPISMYCPTGWALKR